MALQSSFLSVTQFVGPRWTWENPWDQCRGGKEASLRLCITRGRGATQRLICQYHLKCPWVSLWRSPSSLGGQGTPAGPRSLWSPVQSLRWHQMLHCRLLRRLLRAAEEELLVGVRVSWGVAAACKSGNSLQLSAWWFYVTPTAAPPARELLAIVSHFLQMQRFFQLAPSTLHAAGSKEGSTCRGEHRGDILICPALMRRTALDRAGV